MSSANLAANAATLNHAILDAMERFGAAPAFQVKRGGRFRDISYRYFRRQTLRLTHYFRERGAAGERVAIVAANSPEWMVCHMACLLAGGVVVPLRHSLPRQALAQLLENCAPRFVVVESAEQAEWLVSLCQDGSTREGAGFLPEPLHLLTFEAEDKSAAGPRVDTLAAATAERLESEEIEALIGAAAEVPPQALAGIFYTTFHDSNQLIGAMFDQGQRLQSFLAMRQWLALEDDAIAYTALPWSYVPSLLAAMCYFLSGVPNVLARSRDGFLEDIQQTSPTVTMTIPNALERVYDELVTNYVQTLPESSQELFIWALATGRQFRAAGSNASPELKERFERADRTFFAGIRGGFGGRFRRFYCTGAALPRHLAEAIGALGLEPINLYSVTEAGGFPAANLAADQRIQLEKVDACGSATPGFEIELAADGEILVRGATVMRGYWRQPEATAEALIDGWLHTGDYGRFDDHGQLTLLGRKGDSLILSTGRKVSPARPERLLKASPFVAEAAVLGEARPYLVALIVPDLDELANAFRDRESEADPLKSGIVVPATSTLKWFWNVTDDHGEKLTTTAHPRIKEVLDELIAEVNEQVPEGEQIRAYALVGQQLSVEAHQLSDDLAHDRANLAHRFAEVLQTLYPSSGLPNTDREITQVNVGPERLRELLEKENILDAWTSDAGIEFLLGLARDHGIDAPSVVHICDSAAGVAQMESEGVPLSTAIIVGDPIRIHRVLPSGLIQLNRIEPIRRMRHRLTELARLVDGQVLAFVVDRHGYLRGVCRLSLDLPPAEETILGPQFRLHAEISRRCDALVFLVPRGGKQVRVFSQGRLVGRYSHGDWTAEPSTQVRQVVDDLAARRQILATDLLRLLRCAFRMSEENLGALFMIGDADAVLARSDAPDISHLAWISSTELRSLSDDELITLAKQDGATVIDASTSRFRACMVLLRPAAGTHADHGSGKGSRHSSAAKMSAEVGATAITVSQDGSITVYDAGRRVLLL